MGTIAERCAASVRDLKQLAREATELLQDSTHIIGSTQTMLSHTQQELDRLGCLMDEASETSNRQTACLSEAATACRLAEKMRGRMAVAGNCIPAMSARFYDFADQVRQLAFVPEEHSEPILRGTLKRRNRPVLRLVSNAPTNPDGTGVP
jgi:hypothetical protein